MIYRKHFKIGTTDGWAVKSCKHITSWHLLLRRMFMLFASSFWWWFKICRKDFADYAEFCFKTFGDRVKNWFSFNEPRVVAALGYDNGFFAPGRCSKPFGNCTEGDSATEPYIVAHNLILCHASAAQRYREKYQVIYSLFFSVFPCFGDLRSVFDFMLYM